MITYLLKSAKITEPVVFKFNSNGYLIAFESMGLTTKQLEWLYERFPANIQTMEALRKDRRLTITKVVKEITFDVFYLHYASFYGSSIGRKEAETVWKRYSKAKHVLAYEGVAPYAAKCKNNRVAMKQTPSYLQKEPWND